LIDLLDGRLPSGAEAPVRGHLAACPSCTKELARLEYAVTLLRDDALEDAPTVVQARAARLLLARNEATRPSRRRRLLAVLRFDSAQRPLALGARAGQLGARQLLFLGAGHELDLRIAPADTLWAVTGQLLGPADAGEVLLQGAAATWHGVLNDLGEFTLPPVPAGSYILSLRPADLDLDVPEVTVGYPV
jgi:anti-sigma factor RsiW